MANLNPLAFRVAVQDDATARLNIIQQEFEKLRDKTISIKVDGIDDLQRLMKMLGEQQTKSAQQVGDAAKTTGEQIQKLAQSAIKGSFEQFINDLSEVKKAVQNDNFTAFSKRVEACAESIKKLTEAFSQFKTTIGENKDLKDIMAGWGAAIREVSAAMAAMNATKGAGSASNKKQNDEIRQQEEGLIKVVNALGRVREATAGGGSGAGVPFMENITKVGERNIQTLIKEQGHIERLIAIAKKSIDFGEGHPVLGMGRLRGDQMQNLQYLEQLKKVINEILFAANQGDQVAIRFLNTLGSLKTTPFGKDQMGNNISLLGGHFNNLTHSVTNTSMAMRQLEKDMRLDSNTWANAEQQSNLRRYNQMLADAEKLLRRLEETGSKSNGLGLSTTLTNVGSRDVFQFLEKALQFKDTGNFRALNELIGQFSRLKSVYGEVAREQEKMNAQTEKTTTKKTEVMETNQRRYNQALEATVALMNRLEVAGQRGGMLGMDMTKTATALKEAQVFYERMASFGNAKLGDNHAVSELIAGFTNLKIAITPVINQQEKLITQREKLLGMSAESYAQGKVNLFSNQNTAEIQKQIDAVGALYSQIQKLEQELARAGMAMQTISPTRWDELARSGLYKKGVSYEAQMAQLRKEQIYPGDMQQQKAIIQENLERLRSLIGAFKAEGLDVGGFKSQLDALFVTFEKFAALKPIDIGQKLGLEHLRGYTGPQSSASDATWAAMKRQAEIQEVAGEAAKIHQRKLEELTNTFAQHDAQVAKSQRVQNGSNKARRESVESLRKQSEELVKARREMLRSQASDLSGLLSKGKGVLGVEQYDAARNALRSVREEMRQIESVMQRIGSYSTRELFGIGRGSGMDYSPLISSTQRLIATKEQAARASQQMTSEEQRLAQAMNQTTQAAHGQSQVMSDLKSMAMQYLGVWGGQQFIHNIIETGGQLEMQRLSIGAILQDTAHANELFERIKNLATQSPFGVVQLDQMTKQLTAYGFKYNELYDMTNRLANISAATGTSVDRLALALGHVRSEAALSGYTLRQFAMGNVPLLAKLSEKLGKTSKEIRDMVKKKEIGYEDVVGVLKDLTDEGGMFYNMQEVISESVKAKFKNVRDAMDIMYGEMAEGAPGDALKEVANVLMELTRGWKDVATVLGTVTVMWGAHKAAVMLNAKVMGEQNARTIASISAFRAKEAAMLKTATTYRTLTAAERSQIATSKLLTAQERIRMALHIPLTANQKLRIQYARQQYVSDLKVAVAEKKLTTEYILRQVALGKLTKAEAAQILTGNAAALSALNNTRVLGAWRRATLSLTLGITKLGAALKSLLLNPAMLGMAGITAVMELWQRNSRELDRAKELNDDIYNRSQEGLKNTRLMMQNTGIRVDWRKDEKDKWSDVTGTFGQQVGGIMRFVKPDFDKDNNIEGTLDAWKQYIRDYAATPNRIINAAITSQEKETDEDGIERVTTKIREQREQYDLLYESVIKVAEAQKQMQSLSDDMEFAVNETNGGWLNEDLLTNIGDYDEQVKKVSQNIGKTYADLRNHIDKTIRKAQKEDQDFANATKGMDNYAQAFDLLVKKHKEYSKADEIFKNASFGVSSAYESLLDGRLFDSGTMSGLDSAKKTMEDDLDQFFTSLENQLRTKKDWHIDEVIAGKMTLSEDKQQALLSSWKDTLSKVPRLTDETARELTEKFAERYHIQIDADTENAIVKLSMLEQSLNNLVNGDYKVNIDSMTNSDAVFDKLKKDYKAAKTFIETSKPILAKFGISFTGKALSKDQIDKALAKIADENIREEVGKILEGFNQAVGELGKTEEAANNIGLKLEDEKKNKKKSGKAKAYKDEFAKRWDERIRIMKEAYDWYDKWEKKVGNDEAIKETNSKYADIFAEWRTDKLLPMNFDVKEIADYTKYVEKIRDDALKRYQAQKNDKGKNNGQEALRVYRQAVSLLNDVKFDNFTKAAEDFKSIIDQTIEDLNERWDIFNTVRDATGNVGLASSVAGFGAAEKNARTSADAMRNELQSLLLKAGGENLLGLIPLDINIDEESLRKQFEQAIPQTDDLEGYKEKIDGLVKAYQEWQKLQRKVVKDDISTFANLIGSVVSYDAKIKKIRDNLRKQKESIANAVGADGKPLSQKDKDNATAIAQTQADWEEMKLSADYANIYNNAIAMSREEFDSAASSIERMLEKLRELELISPEDYVSEREKLNKARNEWSATGFLGERGAVGQFISGGYEGLTNYYAERRDKANRKAAQYKEGSAENVKWKTEADHYGKLFNQMSKLSDSTKDVITAFQTLQAGLDLITNLFDSLGMEGAANVAGDASGILGSGLQGAQSLSALGPWGMAAGAALGLVSGIAQTHDKALERQIGKLREDVQKIEENTKLIQQARERTLGFDTGELRMSYAQDYKPNIDLSKYPLGWPFLTPFDSTAQKDMYEYYERNSSGTGYQQEYQNLLDQRKDYLEILDAQESKKKKSQSDIEETKGKIAELDDQIRYFTQDLAKELFSIDIKGWADQLSDALASAFENGENMAKAYKDTVRNILQQVMQKMMQLKILEPMFESLQEKLFGKNGVFNPADPKGSLGKITSVITDFFGKGGEGEKTITAATEFMAAFQRGVQNSGLSILNDTSNTLSSGIQGTSEETSDLLAGYVNALRQDVSVNRILLNQFITEYWPSYVEEFKKSVKSLSNIDNNTRTIMEMMESGRGAMYEQIASLRQRFDNVVNGIENLSVR